LTALVVTGTAAAAVDLQPAGTSHLVGETATLTATLTFGTSGRALADRTVTFTVNSGPNAGVTGTGVTDANGKATFSYSSSKTGTDHITASGNDGGNLPATSNDATVTWSTPAPPTPPKTDVGVSIKAPSLVRVGQNGTWTATVANAGPDPATGVVFRAATPAGATLVSASGGNSCTGSTCSIGTLAAGASATVTLVYAVNQAGALTVTSTVESDFDTNASNNTAAGTATALPAGTPPPPPPAPSQPGTFNAIGTGTVLVNGAQRPADQVFQLNSGDTVDVTDGIMTFTAADGSTGNFSSAQPTSRRTVASAAASLPAQFTVSQPASGGVTSLTLVGGDFSSCASKRSLAANKKPIRALWGSAKGNFRTTGRYAAATVRGTIWLVQDRCDGTLTQVVDGVVSVVDSARKKTVTVNAGASYLAAPVAPLKVPTQSAALVKKRGLLYAGRLYKTRKAFDRYLRVNGHTWAEFARKYPGLSAALAKRKP
jgi:uncharacterized repeat protein (TIGR01451 family)